MRSVASNRAGIAFLGLLVVASASCGRTLAPTQAARTGDGSGSIAGQESEWEGAPFVPGQAIIVLKAGEKANEFMSANQLEVTGTLAIGSTTFYLVHSKNNPLDPDLINRLSGLRGVESVSPNYRTWAPEDDREPMAFDDGDGHRLAAQYSEQDYVAQTKLDQALAASSSDGLGSRVAILDTGAYSLHDAFKGQVDASAPSFVEHDLLPWDSRERRNARDDDGDGYIDEAFGHGTHVAGIVHLAAPNASLYAVKVLDDDGWGTVFGLSNAITYAAAQLHVDVINLSLGMQAPSPILEEAIVNAASLGVQMVASAGNQASTTPQYPASYRGVLSVAAVDDKDLVWKYNNANSDVDLTAPGVKVISAVPKDLGIGDYAISTGTSMAAPFVTGAIALTLSTLGCSPKVAAERVRSHSFPIDDLNRDSAGNIGHGRVDFLAALSHPEMEGSSRGTDLGDWMEPRVDVRRAEVRTGQKGP